MFDTGNGFQFLHSKNMHYSFWFLQPDLNTLLKNSVHIFQHILWFGVFLYSRVFFLAQITRDNQLVYFRRQTFVEVRFFIDMDLSQIV